MENQRGKDLLEKLKNGTITEDERVWLEEWYLHFAKTAEPLADYEVYKTDMQKMDSALAFSNQAPHSYKIWRRIAAAASIIIAIGAGIYFTQNKKVETPPVYVNDIAPGKNIATLTLADGSIVPLSDAKTGLVVSNDLRYNDNTLVANVKAYAYPNHNTEGAIPNLTATTPKGGMYSIILPDNTKVWLNNASKLEFPAKFEKNAQRIVKLTGEAYFEVARDAKRPFVVKSNGQDVTVLGTHFNISAYPGEGIKTTLLEGSVRVASLLSPLRGEMSAGQRGEVTLKPNQQSLITGNNDISVKQVDASAAIDWKNGKFAFDSEELGSIMRKVARWYNVEIIYQDKIENVKVTGSISRYGEVSQLLNMLETTGGVHFKIDGKKIIVMK